MLTSGRTVQSKPSIRMKHLAEGIKGGHKVSGVRDRAEIAEESSGGC